MPELPEVETIVRGLRTAIIGESIRRVEVLHTDVLRQPKLIFSKRVRLRRIDGIERRGKNVLLLLNEGWLIKVNLGMTGRLLPFPRPPRGTIRPTHSAVRLRFSSGALLVFDDTRRFGSIEALTSAEWNARADLMGPEPLDTHYQVCHLLDGLNRSSSPVRSWLLDQKRIAGVGNIYANEALYLARIHPQREARSVTPSEAESLHRSLRSILRDAIDAGGTTIRDYRNANGDKGEYAGRLGVYGREGAACFRCNDEVHRVVFSNRSAFYCPSCQPRWRSK